MRLLAPVRELVRDQIAALDQLEARRSAYAEQIAAQAKHSGSAQRLQTIAGVGPTTAAAFMATVGAPQEFRNGRRAGAHRLSQDPGGDRQQACAHHLGAVGERRKR